VHRLITRPSSFDAVAFAMAIRAARMSAARFIRVTASAGERRVNARSAVRSACRIETAKKADCIANVCWFSSRTKISLKRALHDALLAAVRDVQVESVRIS
jgi:hypothetical protein